MFIDSLVCHGYRILFKAIAEWPRSQIGPNSDGIELIKHGAISIIKPHTASTNVTVIFILPAALC
jgi:hypothetical protein